LRNPFRIRRSEGILEVRIIKELRRGLPGSADSKRFNAEDAEFTELTEKKGRNVLRPYNGP
jgi:hypothetical protein